MGIAVVWEPFKKVSGLFQKKAIGVYRDQEGEKGNAQWNQEKQEAAWRAGNRRGWAFWRFHENPPPNRQSANGDRLPADSRLPNADGRKRYSSANLRARLDCHLENQPVN
jgi:hypothetical protein